MAISQVRAQLNGTWYTLALNSATGAYEAAMTAPGTTSYNLAGGYYPVTVEVTNSAGTVVTDNAADNPALRLVVHETVKPVITIVSPTQGAYLDNNIPTVTFTVTDENGGSGVKLSSVSLALDGTAVTGMTSTAISGGYQFTWTPADALDDGTHTITVNAQDNDGNAAEEQSAGFIVDTVPPALNVFNPVDGMETNTAELTVSGVTNDDLSSPVTITVSLNGVDQGAVTVDENGEWDKAVTLDNGENTIVIRSTDKAGKYSEVTRSVTLDTSVPVIASVSITPNPVDINGSMVISVVIE